MIVMNQKQVDEMISKGIEGVEEFAEYFDKAPAVEKPYLYYALCGAISVFDISSTMGKLRKIDGYLDALYKMKAMRQGVYGKLVVKAHSGCTEEERNAIIEDPSMPDWVKYVMKKWNEDYSLAS